MNGDMEVVAQDQGMILQQLCWFQTFSYHFFCPSIYLITFLFFFCNVIIVWAQDDLLKLLDSMKVALPQKDLTKYKTSESHLDWQKVAFNSYTAEMCKQKWQEVSKEVSHIKWLQSQTKCSEETAFRTNLCFHFIKIRKFRTLTELIFDAQDYIKNPYKGKKLKVSCTQYF